MVQHNSRNWYKNTNGKKMKTEEFQRAVRTLCQITPNDTAVVIAIRHANGQILTVNTGDVESRRILYKTLQAIPPSTPCAKTTVREEDQE